MRFLRIFGGPRVESVPEVKIESPEDLARLAEQNNTVQSILEKLENNRKNLHQQAEWGGRTADDVLVERRYVQNAVESLRTAGFIVDPATIESF